MWNFIKRMFKIDMPQKLKPNYVKILEAILYVIEKGQKDSFLLTRYGIVKSIFAADYFHLNQYGRPVTFDNITAFEFGPAPSTAYDFIKEDCSKFTIDGETLPLWETRKIGGKKRDYFEYFNVKRKFNQRKLSISDIKALDAGYEEYKKNGFDGTYDWTHELEAYKQAWANKGIARSKDMDFNLLLTNPDPDLINDLVFISNH